MDLSSGEVLRLIGEGEGKSLEFKRGLSPGPRIARTLCAFANTRGGLLLVGVTDRGAIWGVPRPAEVAARLRELCEHAIEPALKVQLQTLRLASLQVVCCSVPLSPARPHAVRREGGDPEVVIRAGSSNREASGATLRALRQRPSRPGGPSALEKLVLAWVERSSRGARDPASRVSRDPEGSATVAGFARAHDVGLQRARRAFVELERAGRLIGHGLGARRDYSLP